MINDYVEPMHVDGVSDEIEKLNRSLPRPLPNQFAAWLAVYGGSSVRPELAMPVDGGAAVLDSFLSADDIGRTYRARGSFAEFIPEEFVMVGYGPGGGLCLSLRIEDHGSIWFADFDMAGEIVPEGNSSMDIMMKLSRDWDSFARSR